MLVLPLFIVLLVWYLVICLKWKKNTFNLVEKIPGLKWYPFLGTFSVYQGISREDILYKFAEVAAKYGPFYRSWHGTAVPEVHLTTPEHIQAVLRNSTHTEKGDFYKALFPWLGEGIFISEGAKWFLQRKLLTPTFHFKILDSFIGTFGEKTNHLIKVLEPKADGQYFNITADIAECTLRIIFETSVGVPIEAVTDNPLNHVKNVYAMTELVMWRYWRPYIKNPIYHLLPKGRQYRKVLNDLKEFSDKVIAYKRQVRRTAEPKSVQNCDDSIKNTSFLDLVMEATDDQSILSDSDLKSLLDTLLLAGYETTSNTASWAIFLLGNNPEVQEKAFQEVRRVLKGKDAPTTMFELNEMKYLECVIKETLRLYPVLPLITRRLSESIKIDEYTVPAGTQAMVHIFLVQRNPEYYPEPNKFDPERFTPENSKNRHPFAYIPFSAGPRNCLGMRFALLELRAVLATMINKYKMTSLQTEEEMKLFVDIVLRPQSGINVKLERRE